MKSEARKFGRRVRKLRVTAGLSQAQLAELADISLKYLGEIERGRANPTLLNIVALGAALGLNLVELFDYTEEDGGGNPESLTQDKILRLLEWAKDEDRHLYYKILKAIVL